MNTKYVIGGFLTLALIGVTSLSFAIPAMAENAGEGTFFSRVAQILNLDESKLQAAMKQARVEDINEKVESGALTQAQADQMTSRIGESDGYGFMMGRGKGKGMMMDNMKESMEGVANMLGLSLEEMHTARQEGKTITDLANEKNVSIESIKSFLKTEMESNINQAFEDGKITELQKSKMLENVDEKIEFMVTKTPDDGQMMKGRGFGFEGEREEI